MELFSFWKIQNLGKLKIFWKSLLPKASSASPVGEVLGILTLPNR